MQALGAQSRAPCGPPVPSHSESLSGPPVAIPVPGQAVPEPPSGCKAPQNPVPDSCLTAHRWRGQPARQRGAGSSRGRCGAGPGRSVGRLSSGWTLGAGRPGTQGLALLPPLGCALWVRLQSEGSLKALGCHGTGGDTEAQEARGLLGDSVGSREGHWALAAAALGGPW